MRGQRHVRTGRSTDFLAAFAPASSCGLYVQTHGRSRPTTHFTGRKTRAPGEVSRHCASASIEKLPHSSAGPSLLAARASGWPIARLDSRRLDPSQLARSRSSAQGSSSCCCCGRRGPFVIRSRAIATRGARPACRRSLCSSPASRPTSPVARPPKDLCQRRGRDGS